MAIKSWPSAAYPAVGSNPQIVPSGAISPPAFARWLPTIPSLRI